MQESYSVPIAIQGETVMVHPVTAALYAEMAAAHGDAVATFDVARRIVAKCCLMADGSPVPFEDLTLASVRRLVEASAGVSAPDPIGPSGAGTPSGTDSGG